MTRSDWIALAALCISTLTLLATVLLPRLVFLKEIAATFRAMDDEANKHRARVAERRAEIRAGSRAPTRSFRI